jgi:hypothetical protein
MKTGFVSGVLFASLASLVAPQDSAGGDTLGTTRCANVLPHEPVLLYEIHGATLAAQVDKSLTVYADGAIRLSTGSDASPGKCTVLQVAPSVVDELRQTLVLTGGLTLCDDQRVVTDVPLHTLTLLGKTPVTRANTFSYWIGDEDYEAVDLALEQFIADQFPEF